MKTINKIRKAVATLANRINRKVKNLSSSFIRAWQIIRGKQLVSKIAGVTQGTRQRALERLGHYNPKSVSVELVREADNQYDTNAVKVMASVNGSSAYHLGYIPADLANMLAPLFDKGLTLLASFKSITGGYAHKEYYGALIEMTL